MAGARRAAGSRRGRQRAKSCPIRVVSLQHHQALEGIGLSKTRCQVRSRHGADTEWPQHRQGDPAAIAAHSRLSPQEGGIARSPEPTPSTEGDVDPTSVAGTGQMSPAVEESVMYRTPLNSGWRARERPDKRMRCLRPPTFPHPAWLGPRHPRPTRRWAHRPCGLSRRRCLALPATTGEHNAAMTPVGALFRPTPGWNSCPGWSRAFDQAEIERCLRTRKPPRRRQLPAGCWAALGSCRAFGARRSAGLTSRNSHQLPAKLLPVLRRLDPGGPFETQTAFWLWGPGLRAPEQGAQPPVGSALSLPLVQGDQLAATAASGASSWPQAGASKETWPAEPCLVRCRPRCGRGLGADCALSGDPAVLLGARQWSPLLGGCG